MKNLISLYLKISSNLQHLFEIRFEDVARRAGLAGEIDQESQEETQPQKHFRSVFTVQQILIVWKHSSAFKVYQVTLSKCYQELSTEQMVTEADSATLK